MVLALSRLIPMALFASVIVSYLRLIRINPRMWPAAAFVIALSAHWIVFYGVVLALDAQPSRYTNVWLNGLAIHTAGTLVYASVVMYKVFTSHARK